MSNSVVPLLVIDRGHIRKPNLKRGGLKSSERTCEYHTAITVLETIGETTKRVHTGKTRTCTHPSFLYRINHLVLSLCLCHVRRLSNKNGVHVKGL
jgi:hypothetical protein